MACVLDLFVPNPAATYYVWTYSFRICLPISVQFQQLVIEQGKKGYSHWLHVKCGKQRIITGMCVHSSQGFILLIPPSLLHMYHSPGISSPQRAGVCACAEETPREWK
jgi:hypothetical protein